MKNVLIVRTTLIVGLLFPAVALADTMANEPEEGAITPTPTFTPPRPEFSELSNREELRQESIKLHAAEGIDYDPREIGKEEQLSKKEWGRRYGPKQDYFELPLEEQIPGCIYVQGYADPTACFGSDRKLIYKEGRDNKSVLENLKKLHAIQVQGAKQDASK